MICLRYAPMGPRLGRVAWILKVRGSRFDPSLRTFTVSDAGMRMGGALRADLVADPLPSPPDRGVPRGVGTPGRDE